MNKALLRSQYIERRQNLSEDLYYELSQQIITQFLFKFHGHLLVSNFISVFLPIEKNHEVNTNLLVKTLRTKFKNLKIVVPVCDFKTNTLLHKVTDQNTFFEENKYGIPEPVNGQNLAEQQLELVIVPLLTFDQRGQRIGYGGGYYDRFLAQTKDDCLKIGFSLFEPTTESFEIEATDIALDYVITPTNIYEFKHSTELDTQELSKKQN
jgi:5-formyltetrahydrofolate cyclo-ligase